MFGQRVGKLHQVTSPCKSYRSASPQLYPPPGKGTAHFCHQFCLNCPFPHLGVMCTVTDTIAFGEMRQDAAFTVVPGQGFVPAQRGDNVN